MIVTSGHRCDFLFHEKIEKRGCKGKEKKLSDGPTAGS